MVSDTGSISLSYPDVTVVEVPEGLTVVVVVDVSCQAFGNGVVGALGRESDGIKGYGGEAVHNWAAFLAQRWRDKTGQGGGESKQDVHGW